VKALKVACDSCGVTQQDQQDLVLQNVATHSRRSTMHAAYIISQQTCRTTISNLKTG
jgi:hypothetical protein